MKYFTPATDPAIDFDRVDMRALEMLEQARAAAGVPFRITSTYRTPERNAEIGGKLYSAHTENPCAAFDIAYSDGAQAYKIIQGLYAAGFERVLINTKNNHVHVDNSPNLPRPFFGVE